MRRLFLVWATLIILVALPSRADDFPLQYKSADGFLEIHAAHSMDPERARSIEARVMRVYEFVARQEAWHNPALLHANPLQFRLVESLKVLGYAQGPNLMVMKDSYMDDPLSEGTLAHELTHIQDLRQLQGAKLPSFMLEGRALTNGNAYRMSLGQEPNSYDHQMASSAVGFTAEQAATLLNEYRGQGWDNQAIGTVLVEFMRTRWDGGHADIHPRLSKMIENMASGVEFEPAFQTEFKTPVTALAQSFGAFLTATQNDPAARLEGTMWQHVVPSGGPHPSEDD